MAFLYQVFTVKRGCEKVVQSYVVVPDVWVIVVDTVIQGRDNDTVPIEPLVPGLHHIQVNVLLAPCLLLVSLEHRKIFISSANIFFIFTKTY